MTVKCVANATQNCANFVPIIISTDEIYSGINTSEQLDPCTVEETMPSIVSVRYPGEMSYIKRFEGSLRRVYGYNYSEGTKNTGKLDIKIDRTEERNERRNKKRNRTRKVEAKVDMNEDVDNLILIAVGYFGLPPHMADSTKLIMARMWSYPDNFHDLKYENVVLGILMYVVYEDLGDAITVNFRKYCTYLLGDEQAERNIRQMYQAYEITRDLYNEVERDTAEQQALRRRRKVYIEWVSPALPLYL